MYDVLEGIKDKRFWNEQTTPSRAIETRFRLVLEALRCNVHAVERRLIARFSGTKRS